MALWSHRKSFSFVSTVKSMFKSTDFHIDIKPISNVSYIYLDVFPMMADVRETL